HGLTAIGEPHRGSAPRSPPRPSASRVAFGADASLRLRRVGRDGEPRVAGGALVRAGHPAVPIGLGCVIGGALPPHVHAGPADVAQNGTPRRRLRNILIRAFILDSELWWNPQRKLPLGRMIRSVREGIGSPPIPTPSNR